MQTQSQNEFKSKYNIEDPDALILNKNIKQKHLELLNETQRRSVAEGITIFKENYQLNLLTGAGGGKTRQIMMIAKHFGLPIFGLMKANAKRAFEAENKHIGVDFIDFISYRKLSSTFKAGETVKEGWRRLPHGYLIVHDYYKEKQTKDGIVQMKRTKFYPTKKLMNLAKKGMLVVLDEAHIIKKDNRGNKAATMVLLSVMMGTRSRFAFLSATQITHPRESEQYLRNLGIITKSKLFRSDSNSGDAKLHKGSEIIFDNTGMGELIDYALTIEPTITEHILEKNPNPKTRKNIDGMLFQFICAVVLPHIGTKSFVTRKMKPCTLFLYVEDPDRRQMIEALSKGMYDLYNQIVENNPTKGIRVEDRSMLDDSLQRINEALIPDVIRYINYIMAKDPGAKVLLFCRRNSIRRKLLKALRKYGTSTVYGGGSIIGKDADGEPIREPAQNEKDRAREIKNFTATDMKTRAIVLNYAAGSESLNLQSRSKKQTMHTFLFMDFISKDQIQASFRTDRFSPTDPYVYLVAPYTNNLPTKIIDNIALKDAATSQVNKRGETYLYPGQYPPQIEDANVTGVNTENYPAVDHNQFIKFDVNYGRTLLKEEYNLDFIDELNNDFVQTKKSPPKIVDDSIEDSDATTPIDPNEIDDAFVSSSESESIEF